MSPETTSVLGNEASVPEVRGLVTKLAKVMGEVERVAKRGRNDFHKYDYATEADIAAAVREHMASEHLLMVPNVEELTWREGKKGSEGAPIATLKVRFTVYDGDTGETLSFHVYGEGQDSGDKATYKAMTGANKYALLKLFQIPTGDDPEREDGAKSGRRGRADRQEALHEQARRESAESGPYAEREAAVAPAPKAEVKQQGPSFGEPAEKLPKDVRHVIPTDPALRAFPPTEEEQHRGFYVLKIKAAVARLTLNVSEVGDLKEQFFGSRRVSLERSDGQPDPRPSIFHLRALYLHLDDRKA